MYTNTRNILYIPYIHRHKSVHIHAEGKKYMYRERQLVEDVESRTLCLYDVFEGKFLKMELRTCQIGV